MGNDPKVKKRRWELSYCRERDREGRREGTKDGGREEQATWALISSGLDTIKVRQQPPHLQPSFIPIVSFHPYKDSGAAGVSLLLSFYR